MLYLDQEADNVDDVFNSEQEESEEQDETVNYQMGEDS